MSLSLRSQKSHCCRAEEHAIRAVETCTVKEELEDPFDGTHTRVYTRTRNNFMVCVRKIREEIYGHIPPISTIVAQPKVGFAGHCCCVEHQAMNTLYFGDFCALIEDGGSLKTWAMNKALEDRLDGSTNTGLHRKV